MEFDPAVKMVGIRPLSTRSLPFRYDRPSKPEGEIMAWFKEVTQPDGSKVTVNLDLVRGMYRKEGEITKIFFDRHQHLDVTETPEQIRA